MTDCFIDRQTDRQTNTQTDRQTDYQSAVSEWVSVLQFFDTVPQCQIWKRKFQTIERGYEPWCSSCTPPNRKMWMHRMWSFFVRPCTHPDSIPNCRLSFSLDSFSSFFFFFFFPSKVKHLQRKLQEILWRPVIVSYLARWIVGPA